MSSKLVAKKRVTNQGLNAKAHYPQAGELSLFDLPVLIRRCIDTLKVRGIGRTQLKCILIVEGKLQLHIHYFNALDALGAEQFERGVDLRYGLYLRYRLPVCSEVDIVWVKLTGIWSHVKQGAL